MIASSENTEGESSIAGKLPYSTITAVLFSKAPAGHLDQRSLDDFLHTLQSIYDARSNLSIKYRPLDGLACPRVFEARSDIPSEAYLPDLRKHRLLADFEQRNAVELILRASHLSPARPPRLAVFDLDSTLIEQEVIDELAASIGAGAAVAAITARAMAGELDFAASLHERVKLLKGVPTTVWEDLKQRITFTPGVEVLLKVLKRLGCRTAVLSGGFIPMARYVADCLGIDHVHANELAVSEDGSFLTGELREGSPIVHAERKRELLVRISEEEGVAREDVMAVGDGANDLLMLKAAGLGVAFNAKEKVQREAPVRLNGQSLVDLLQVLGFTRDEIEDLAR